MFGFDINLEWLRQELTVIWEAKVSFLAILLLLGFLIWFGVKEYYSGRLDGYRDQLDIEMLKVATRDEQILDLKAQAAQPGQGTGSPPAWSTSQVQVSNRSFANETVVIDGKLFVDCTFTNVTLLYEGTGNVSFIRAKWNGLTYLKTEVKPAMAFHQLAQALKDIPNMQYMEGIMDSQGQIHGGDWKTTTSPDAKEEKTDGNR